MSESLSSSAMLYESAPMGLELGELAHQALDAAKEYKGVLVVAAVPVLHSLLKVSRPQQFYG